MGQVSLKSWGQRGCNGGYSGKPAIAKIGGAVTQAKFGAIEPVDREEAVNAAGPIGDDTLQRIAGKGPNPRSLPMAHLTSACSAL